MPIRRTWSVCCARAASGQAAVPLSVTMNSRRPSHGGHAQAMKATIPRSGIAVCGYFTLGGQLSQWSQGSADHLDALGKLV
jgi:hypothetical protein